MVKIFKVTKKKILDVLKHNEWKTDREIRDELSCGSSALGTIYVYLTSLEDEGYVEWRERTVSKEILEIRGEHPPHEFRLTHDGVRRRIEQDTKKRSRTYGHIPADELA